MIIYWLTLCSENSWWGKWVGSTVVYSRTQPERLFLWPTVGTVCLYRSWQQMRRCSQLGLCLCHQAVNSSQEKNIAFARKIIPSRIKWRQKGWHTGNKQCLRQCARVCLSVRVCLPVCFCQNMANWWLMIVCMLVGEEVKICHRLHSVSW